MTAVAANAARIAPEAGILWAQRSLAMAGQALDPNGLGGPDLPLAALLLAHALVAIARAVDKSDAVSSTAAAIATLERASVLRRAAGGKDGGRRILEWLGDETACPRDPAPLVEAELLLRSVVRVVRGDPAIARARRRRLWGLALLACAAVGVASFAKIRRHEPWEKYRWTASSAAYGFGPSGLLGEHGASGLVFHTDLQPRPWVTIDLLEVREIHSVTVTNRADCCDLRCLPLIVEVAGGDARFVEVGRQTKPFAVWQVEFPRRRARTVRLRVEATTYFHLAEIEIR